MKPVFIIAIVAVAMIGVMVPNVFAESTYSVDMAMGSGAPGCETSNACYLPADITISTGDTVQWNNVDTAAHTVSGGSPADGPSGVFDSSLLMPGSSYSHTFNDAGNYDYFCMVHPWMVGSVTLGNNVDVGNSSSFVTQSILQSDKSIYELMKHGEITVNIFGHIENSSRGDKVIITITQPDGTSSGNAIFLTSSGDYELPYVLNNDSLIGQYQVMISHNEKIKGQISFNVVIEETKFIPSEKTIISNYELGSILYVSSLNIVENKIEQIKSYSLDEVIKIKKSLSLGKQHPDYQNIYRTTPFIITSSIPHQNQELFVSVTSTAVDTIYPVMYDITITQNERPILKETVSYDEYCTPGCFPKLYKTIPLPTSSPINIEVSAMISSTDTKKIITLQMVPEPIPEPIPEPEPLGIASFVDQTKDPQHYIDRYNNEPTYKQWFDENYSQYYSIYEAIGMDEPIVESVIDYTPEPIVQVTSTPTCGTGTIENKDGICVRDTTSQTEKVIAEVTPSTSLPPISSSIKEGMWARYQLSMDFNIPASPFTNPEAMRLSMLSSMYGLPSTSSMSLMKYQINNVDGIQVNVVDVESTSCKTQLSLVMKDGTKENMFGTNSVGNGWCDIAQEIRNKKLGDYVADPIFGSSQSQGPLSLGEDIQITDFDTITINGKKVDVIVATGKSINRDSSSSTDVETKMFFHKHTGLLLETTITAFMNMNGQSGNFKFSLYAVDVSEHFVGTPITPTLGGGCLIATATYGSELAPQVQQLRELRDNQLLQTESGTVFMSTFNDVYYSFSPIIADYERENPLFKEAVKIAITPMISTLSLMENANSESEVLGIGMSVIMLNLGMYLGVPAIVVIGIRKRI